MSNPTELQESYRILELDPGAPLAEVEQAYERLAKSWEPRRFGNDEPRRRKAEKKLRQLNRAYETLSAELGDGRAPAAAAAPEETPAESPPMIGPPRHWTEFWLWRYLWIGALVLAMAYLICDSILRYQGITRTTYALTVTDYPLPERDPKSSTGYANNQHVQVLPALGTDGQHWTMQTERMLDGREGWRVRHVDYDGIAPEEQISDNKVRLSSSQAEQLAKSGSSAGAQNSAGAPPEEEVTGRDIHWSSALHWLSAGLAWVVHIVKHEPMIYALEETVSWANTFALGTVMLLLPIAIFRRFGSIATALLALTFIAVYPYYEFSFVGYFDHHGLAATAELLMVLFLASAGAGWVRNSTLNPDSLTPTEKALWRWLPERRQAKRWMIASGIAASGGLWISTASVVPAMFGIGVAALICTGFMMPERSARTVEKNAPWVIALGAGLGASFCLGGNWRWGWADSVLGLSGFGGGVALTAIGGVVGAICGAALTKGLLFGSETQGAKMVGQVDATLWRVWGTSAGLASLFFYLLEYAPAHFSMRLEVNHPFYALALFGAGDVLCRVSLLMQSPDAPGRFEEAWQKHWPRLLGSLALVALLPVTIFLFGERVFVIRQGEFLMNLHQDYILEFRSFLTQLSTLSPMQIVGGISFIPLTAVPMTLLIFSPELQRPWKAVLLVVLLPALVMLGLAMFQIRWLGISCAMWCAGLATAAMVTTSSGSAFRWQDGFRRPLAIFLVLIVLLPFPINSAIGWFNNRDSVGDLDLQQVVTRDVSERLRMRLGNETGVILSGPTTTTWMLYFGGFHGLGTLYWENVKGLETAAKIYSANCPNDNWDEARKLIQQYHVTHIAIFSWDPFADQYARLGAGFRLPKTNQDARDSWLALKDSFIIKLWDPPQWVPPPWLRLVYYQVPNSPMLKGQNVMLLEVVPEQSPLERYTRYAQYMLTQNDPLSQKKAGDSLNIIFTSQYADYYPAIITRAMLEQVRAGQELARAGQEQATGMVEQASADQAAGNADVAAFKADVQTLVDNLKKTDEPGFAFEDRAYLARLLYENNHIPEANAQVQAAFATATEKDIRHVMTDRLLFMLQVQAHMPPEMKVPEKTLDLAMSLLPAPLRGKVLAERAGVALPTDRALAMDLYRQTIKLSPEFEPALTALATILVLSPDASQRNGPEALELLDKAAKAAHLQTIQNIELLAYASAEANKFDDAIFYSHTALMLLEDIPNTAEADKWRLKIKRFENHQIGYEP